VPGLLRAFAAATLTVFVLFLEPPSTVAEPVAKATAVDVATASTTEAAAPETPSVSSAAYTGGGVDACIECHDQPAVLSVLKTRHAVKGDARTPLGHADACETCHGPGASHAEDPDVAMPVLFGTEQRTEPQDATCIGCHQGGSRIHWSGSEHESHDVPCAACHQIHAPEDPMLVRDIRPESFVRRDQSAACYTCHQDVRAQIHRLSAHPIKEGRVVCSDCHNAHGSTTDHLLAQETLNETCYECHAEKRGPFLWEHQPARDDCSTCHTPHGSTHENLLAARGPWLCQSCHMASRHPSGAYGGSGLPGGAPNRNLLAKNCTNCHSEVHGTNHPSGVRLTR
jgi:DmsE family decaheme c-type cytochrome